MSGSELLSKQRRYNIGEYKNLNRLTANTVTVDYLKFGMDTSNVTITYPENLINEGYTLALPNRSGNNGEFLGIDDNNNLIWGNPSVIKNIQFKYGSGLDTSVIDASYTQKTIIFPDNYDITITPTSTTSKLLIQFRCTYIASFGAETAISFYIYKTINNNKEQIQAEAKLGPINATGTNRSQYITSTIIESNTTEKITISIGFSFDNIINIDSHVGRIGILGENNNSGVNSSQEYSGYKNSIIVTEFEGSGLYSTLLSKSHDNESIYYNLGTLYLGSNYTSVNTNNESGLSLITQEGISAPVFIGNFEGNITSFNLTSNVIDTNQLEANIFTTNILTSNIITTNIITTNIITSNIITSNILTSNIIITYDISINNSLKTKDLDIFGNLYVHGTQTIVNSDVLNVADNIIIVNADGNIEKQAGIQANIDGNLYDFFFDICLNGWSIYNKSLHLYELIGNNITITENISSAWFNGNINTNLINLLGNIYLNDNYILDVSAIKFSDGNIFNNTILNNKIDIINSNISSLQTEITNNKNNITRLLEGNIDNIFPNIERIKIDVSNNRGNIITLQDYANNIFANIITIKTDISNNRGNIIKLQDNINQPLKTTSNVIFNRLTISDEVIINGNLIVRGNKTIVDTIEYIINDPLITLNSKGLEDNIGIEGNTINGNIIQFVFDQNNNYWYTGGKSIKANIIGDIKFNNGKYINGNSITDIQSNITILQGNIVELQNLLDGSYTLNSNVIFNDISSNGSLNVSKNVLFKNNLTVNGNIIANQFIGELSGNSLTSNKWKESKLLNVNGNVNGNVLINANEIMDLSLELEKFGKSGIYGNNSSFPIITLDNYGRITDISLVNITFTGGSSINTDIGDILNVQYISTDILATSGYIRTSKIIGSSIEIDSDDLSIKGILTATHINADSITIANGSITVNKIISSNAIFTNDITVSGNLSVLGSQTIINSSIVEVDDNIIIVNADGEILKEAGLGANIGDNLYYFLYDICSNSWTTQNNNLKTTKLIANIIDIYGNINFINNNYWINDVSGIKFADGTILTSGNIRTTNENISLKQYLDASFGNVDLSGNITFTENSGLIFSDGTIINSAMAAANLIGYGPIVTDLTLIKHVLDYYLYDINLSSNTFYQTINEININGNITANSINGININLSGNIDISGNLSGTTGNFNKLNMTGNINLDNNWLNDVSGIKFVDGTILNTNVRNIKLNNYSDASFSNIDISGNTTFQVTERLVKPFQVGCEYRFDSIGEFGELVYFKKAFVIENGRPDFADGLIIGNLMEVKKAANVGIHTNIPQAPLDVSATSIFRDRITAEDISLNGTLYVKKIEFPRGNYLDHNETGTFIGDYNFNNNVDITGNLKVSGTFTNSDKRLKVNNIDIINGIQIIKKLKPQIYNKRNKIEIDVNNYYIKESGFIAQDIEEIEELKHLINKPKNIEKDSYTMNYIGLIAYNTAAIKELDNIVESQKVKIINQENRIQELKNKLLFQETLINQLISRIEALEKS